MRFCSKLKSACRTKSCQCLYNSLVTLWLLINYRKRKYTTLPVIAKLPVYSIHADVGKLRNLKCQSPVRACFMTT